MRFIKIPRENSNILYNVDNIESFEVDKVTGKVTINGISDSSIVAIGSADEIQTLKLELYRLGSEEYSD